jgi:hypothetical protein
MNKIKQNLQFFCVVVLIFVAGPLWAQNCSNELEPEIASLPVSWTQPYAAQGDELPIQCISASMDTFYSWTRSLREERREKGLRDIGHYGYCQNENQSTPVKRHIPPCKSTGYMGLIQTVYNDILTCFDISPRQMFSVVAVESGFHVNTLSLTNQDIGIGQLTPIAIDEVNPYWSQGLEYVQNTMTPSCQRLAPQLAGLAPVAQSAQALCPMIALPQNPARNLIYLALLHKKNQSYMDDYFNNTRMSQRLLRLTGVEWTQSQLQNLKEILIFLAYNAGSPGAINAFEGFLQQKQQLWIQRNQEIVELQGQMVALYLQAMRKIHEGEEDQAQSLLLYRESLRQMILEMQESSPELYMSLSEFHINQNPGTFGHYLTQTQTSFYLSILKDRIEYVERQLLNQPEACSPRDFLENIQ